MKDLDIKKIIDEATMIAVADDGKEVPQSLLESYNRSLNIQKEILKKVVVAADGTKVNSDYLEDYNLINRLEELQKAREAENDDSVNEIPVQAKENEVIVTPVKEQPQLLDFEEPIIAINEDKNKEDLISEDIKKEEKDEIVNPFELKSDKTEEFKFDFDKYMNDETAN